MVVTTEPKVEQRAEMPYAGIRVQFAHQEMGSGIIPQLLDEVLAWLQQQGVEPVGPPFMRYYVINMVGNLDVELGWPIAAPLASAGRIQVSALPAGRYASLIYTDVRQGIEGNGVLIAWAEANGLAWDRWDDANGDAFAARVEFYLTEPDDEPDMGKWETEVAIKLA